MNARRYVFRRACSALVAIALTAPLFMATATVAVTSTAHAEPTLQDNPSMYVDPFIGTADSREAFAGGVNPNGIRGDVFPGAVAPQGMLAWSPDTPTAVPGGYWYPDTAIDGFSLTHFSGRGCAYQGDFPFIPVSGSVTKSPVAAPTAFRSTFSHANEHASPGYYDVTLDSGNRVQLAAATRSGIGVFTYAGQPQASLLIDAGGGANGAVAASVDIDPARNLVTGSATSTVGCGEERYTIYFATTFSRSFDVYGTWEGAALRPGTTSASAPQSGAFLTFDASDDSAVVARTAVSYVSIDNAELNLQSEVAGKDLQDVRDSTAKAWNDVLGTIEISGGSEAAQRVFYTALYHFFIEPSVFSDVNGEYRGFDDVVHAVAPGHVHYSDIDTWGGYRSFIQLLALLRPDVASDVIQSLIRDAEQDGPGLPRWVQANRNSAGNVGDDAAPYIAAAYAFGARGFDQEGALRAMDLGASAVDTQSGGHPVRDRGDLWLQYQYVPRWPGLSLEYATDDFSIAQFARSLGHEDMYGTYMTRAQYWQNVLNPVTGYVQPKNENGDGQWESGFTPDKRRGFTEGNSAQYTPMIPFNVRGLINAVGGDERFTSHLDDLFTELNVGPIIAHNWHGNQPSGQNPWMYSYAHAPWKTQQVVRRIQTELYTDQPSGSPGNDDGGSLSSWYVWSVLGMYPITPGTADLVLGSPAFPRAVVHSGNGTTITINGRGAAPDAPFVQQLKLNGSAWPKAYLPSSLLDHGGTLDFTLGTVPNKDWATGANAVPPSYSDGEKTTMAFTEPSRDFVMGQNDRTTVTVAAQNVTHDPQDVTWKADVPAGITLSSASGTLRVPPENVGTDQIEVASGAATGQFRIRIHTYAKDGQEVSDVVLDVRVVKSAGTG
ncbi:GH92 family glycosyl hydrolase [Monashia sp. NPDC004114]